MVLAGRLSCVLGELGGVLERADGVLSELMRKKRPSERVKDQKLP